MHTHKQWLKLAMTCGPNFKLAESLNGDVKFKLSLSSIEGAFRFLGVSTLVWLLGVLPEMRCIPGGEVATASGTFNFDIVSA
jgi:hypothetical protein